MELRKDRIRWQDDDKYLAFERIIYKNFWTFEEALEFSSLKELIDDIVLMKELWLKKIKRWNELETQEKPGSKFIPELSNKDSNKYIIGFAALNFLVILLPYENLKNPEIFTEFYINQINIIRIYFHTKENLKFKGVEPIFIEDFANREIDEATWWIGYFIFERKNNLPTWIISPPTQLLNKN